jgi:hypothetical protein
MRPWTSTEEDALRILAPRLGGKACAAAFERSLKSVERKAAQLGVSLRRISCGGNPGEACSPVVLRRVRELTLAELCPACGKRPISVKATGLCGRCHFDGLRIVHEDAIAKADGQLALWASRSKLQRRRSELGKLGGAPGDVETDDKAHD